MPDPEHVCCSPVLYKNWRVTHSGLSSSPVTFLKSVKREDLRGAVLDLLKTKEGGVILLGCELAMDGKGRTIPVISRCSARSKAKREEFQKGFEEVRKHLHNINRNLEHGYVRLKEDPLSNPETTTQCMIPRIVVGPDLSVGR